MPPFRGRQLGKAAGAVPAGHVWRTLKLRRGFSPSPATTYRAQEQGVVCVSACRHSASRPPVAGGRNPCSFGSVPCRSGAALEPFRVRSGPVLLFSSRSAPPPEGAEGGARRGRRRTATHNHSTIHPRGGSGPPSPGGGVEACAPGTYVYLYTVTPCNCGQE